MNNWVRRIKTVLWFQSRGRVIVLYEIFDWIQYITQALQYQPIIYCSSTANCFHSRGSPAQSLTMYQPQCTGQQRGVWDCCPQFVSLQSHQCINENILGAKHASTVQLCIVPQSSHGTKIISKGVCLPVSPSVVNHTCPLNFHVSIAIEGFLMQIAVCNDIVPKGCRGILIYSYWSRGILRYIF